MSEAKLVIFDCDGTLVDSEVIACEVFPQYWATHGVNISVDDFKEKFIGVGNNSDIGRKFFSQMPPHADEEGDRLFADALANELKAVEGIEKVLSSLEVDMCVASNSSLNHVRQAMLKSDLSSFFGEKLFSAHQVENSKPNPDLFLYASSQLGFKVEDIVVVEDSVSGIEAAQRAGMNVIAFSGAAHFTPHLEKRLEAMTPDWLCRSVEDLGSLLLSLTKAE